MYGIFAFGRGLGNVLAAPVSVATRSDKDESLIPFSIRALQISTALLSRPSISPNYGMGEYGSLILFTGAALTMAGFFGGAAWGGSGKLSRRLKRA